MHNPSLIESVQRLLHEATRPFALWVPPANPFVDLHAVPHRDRRSEIAARLDLEVASVLEATRGQRIDYNDPCWTSLVPCIASLWQVIYLCAAGTDPEGIWAPPLLARMQDHVKNGLAPWHEHREFMKELARSSGARVLVDRYEAFWALTPQLRPDPLRTQAAIDTLVPVVSGIVEGVARDQNDMAAHIHTFLGPR